MKNDVYYQSYVHSAFFLASSPMIEIMSQWKALISFGDSTLASAICYCLNFQQGLKRNEIPRPKLISPNEITGKTKIYNGVCGNTGN